MKPSINSIEVKALQKIVSEWENNKLKDADDAITFGTKADEAKGMRVKLSGTIQPTASDEAKSDTSGATPITTGYDKAKSDLSGVVRLNSDTSGTTTVTTSGALPPAESGAMETKYTGSVYATSPYNGSIDELIQATTSWNTSASDFALNMTDMAGKTTDCVTLFTANNDALSFVNQSPSLSLTMIQ